MGSQLFQCTNRRLIGNPIPDLGGSTIVHAHLFHHAVEEVFSLLGGSGGQDLVELVEEGKQPLAIDGRQLELLAVDGELPPSA
jgi:hypothetical protein